MKRVTGIGGVFFKAADAERLREWYHRHLGIDVQSWGGAAFEWRAANDPELRGQTVWSVFPSDTKYFDPSPAPFMVNYRVENLKTVLDLLRSEGVQVDERVEESEFGRFGWAMDGEGNRIELWEPPPQKE
jgi:catechol 2,3-dioxygenase-like lactoylglutathione lyase family enzyme